MSHYGFVSPYADKTHHADVHLLGAGRTQFACIIGIVEYKARREYTISVAFYAIALDITYDGSIEPLRVAPGNPAKGVRPILTFR